MTAFAISWERNRLTVASDTLAYAPDRVEARPIGFTTKIWQLPHLHAVMFARGQIRPAVSAYATLLQQPHIIDIEDAAISLPGVISACTDLYCAEQGVDDSKSANMLEVVLAGWSERDCRMKLFQFFNITDYAMQDAGEGYCTTAYPQIPNLPTFSGRATDRDLVRIVQAIGADMKRDPVTWCGCRVGGEVVAVTVTPRSMDQRILHRFPDYDETRTAAAAIVARILRGDLDVSEAVRLGLVTVADMAHAA